MDPNSYGSPNTSPGSNNGSTPYGSPDPRLAATGSQQQPAFLGWAVQPTTAYQLVPLDGAYIQYQPVFAQQPVPVPPPVTPLRRQVSIGILQPAPALGTTYYQAAASPQQQPAQTSQQPAQQQVQVQQPAQVPGTVPSSNQTYTCSLVFTTPPPPPPSTMSVAGERPLPTSPLSQPATLPRTSLRRVSSTGIARQHRPRALSLAPEDYLRQPASSPLRMPRRRPGVVASNGGNGGGYDGDSSSYSTSPLGSDFEHHAAAAASFRLGQARLSSRTFPGNRSLRSWNRRSVREATVGAAAPSSVPTVSTVPSVPTTSRATQHDGDAEDEPYPHPDDGISSQLEALHLDEDVGETSNSAQHVDCAVRE